MIKADDLRNFNKKGRYLTKSLNGTILLWADEPELYIQPDEDVWTGAGIQTWDFCVPVRKDEVEFVEGK